MDPPTSDIPDLSWPPSLSNLIMSHHRGHSSSLRLAHYNGIGRGYDAFLPTLGEYSQHTHVTDPNEHFEISTAQNLVINWCEANWWKGRFTFAVSGIDEPEMLVNRTVDLVIMLQTAHETERGETADHDSLARRMASSLAPNGTLAVVQRSLYCKILDNPEVANAVERLYEVVGAVLAQYFPDISSPG